jgi:F-box and leucine-rich repeat protein GRR1
MKLAALPKLRRIGLVKCSNITDKSVYALAQARVRHGGHRIGAEDAAAYFGPGSSLERVHLSYCTNLTLKVRFIVNVGYYANQVVEHCRPS